ncbi:hypothetical protein EV426DRAFT_704508 [Tirmania nivea]|nr:hypothetical protein EV426DRAFT_704508 [Tirmania nivea]
MPLESVTKERTSFDLKLAQLRVALALHFGKDVTCLLNLGRKLKRFDICVTPIEALGDDQVEKARAWGINATCLSETEIYKKVKTFEAILNGEYDLGFILPLKEKVDFDILIVAVYLPPEKLMELNSAFQKLLKACGDKKHKQIAFVVIDEAHLVEDWYDYSIFLGFTCCCLVYSLANPPAGHTKTPAGHTKTPTVGTKTPASHTKTLAVGTKTPAGDTSTPTKHMKTPAS